MPCYPLHSAACLLLMHVYMSTQHKYYATLEVYNLIILISYYALPGTPGQFHVPNGTPVPEADFGIHCYIPYICDNNERFPLS